MMEIPNDRYIRINQNTYKIVGEPDLARIYDLIILDEPEGTLDEIYYDLIDKDE